MGNSMGTTDIALLHNVTIYDAYYLGLAVHMDSKFITADSKFYKKFVNTEYIGDIQLLQNYKQVN